MKFICLIFGLLSVFTLQKSGVDAGMELEKQAIDAMSDALDLSKQFLIETVPPKETIEEAIEDAWKRRGSLSGEVVTILLNGQNAHIRATQNVYQWCGLAMDLLKDYIELLNSPVDTKSFVLAVLEDEIDKLKQAQVNLNRFFSSFKEAAGKITNDDAKSKAVRSFAEATDGKRNRVDAGLKNQIEILENLKVQIEASESNESTPELQKAAVDSAQKLITNCVECRKLF